MKLPKYAEMLKKTKEQIDAAMCAVQVSVAKKKMELELAKQEAAIAEQEKAVQDMCSNKDLDIHSLIRAMDTLALAERKRDQMVKIMGELFGD